MRYVQFSIEFMFKCRETIPALVEDHSSPLFTAGKNDLQYDCVWKLVELQRL